MLRVYLETSIPSYLTARRSRDLVVAARQEVTREWWEEMSENYELYVSEYVIEEVSAGDASAAARRIASLQGLPVLQTTSEVEDLAVKIVEKGLIPRKAIRDAYHLASASVHNIEILLTWNCAHIANPELQKQLSKNILHWGYELPFVCTPEMMPGGRS